MGERRFPVRTTCSRPFWLIAEYRTGRLEVLRTSLAYGEQALPVFSFEEEARVFLEFEALDGGWRVRVTEAGELISVLFGSCAGVDWVALDPLPGSDGNVWNGLLSIEREAFTEFAANQAYGGIWGSTGTGNRVGGRSPDRDRVGTKHARPRRLGQRMTAARQASVIVPAATSTEKTTRPRTSSSATAS